MSWTESPSRQGTAGDATGALVRAFAVDVVALVFMTAALILAQAPTTTLLARLEAGADWTAVPLDVLLSVLAAIALCGCSLWLVAVTVVTTVEAVTGASWGLLRAVSPPVVRRLVLLCLGVAVGGTSLIPPAMATPDGAEGEGRATSGGAATALSGLPLPDRVPGEAPQSAAEPRGHAGPAGQRPPSRSGRPGWAALVRLSGPGQASYRIRRGDSLWSISRRLLPAAGDAQVDAAWRRLHRANHHVIGADPDLVLPGTVLKLPATTFPLQHLEGPGELGATDHRKDAS